MSKQREECRCSKITVCSSKDCFFSFFKKNINTPCCGVHIKYLSGDKVQYIQFIQRVSVLLCKSPDVHTLYASCRL